MRGEIWIVALDPTTGTEIQKTRPCLIVSPDDINARLRRVIVAPMTTGSHPAPFRVAIDFRRKRGLVLLDQVRTVDKGRLRSRVGRADDRVMALALEVLRDLFAV